MDELHNFIENVFQFFFRELDAWNKSPLRSEMVLLLPEIFASKTNGRTFASGENLTDGTIIRPALVHEIGHFYASVDWVIATLTEVCDETPPPELIIALREKKTESISTIPT